MRYVKVDFLSDRTSESSNGYFYKDQLSRSLKKYDTIIVPTRHGLALAVVRAAYTESTLDAELQNTSRFSYVNRDNMKVVSEKITSRTVAAAMNKEKAADIKKRLDAEIKKVDAVEKYRVYAELSPAVAEMLKELEELNG